MSEGIPIVVSGGDADTRDVLLQGGDSASSSVSAELCGKGLPIDVG